jgi:hypothetical protein
MDNLRSLRQKVKDYSNFKKETKSSLEDEENYNKERDKQIEQKQFEDYKDRLYGVGVKGGGFIAKGCGKVMGDRRKITKMY